MPGGPNLYDDESDHESVNELLSPSDGYFAEGHTHPGEVLVPDPSQGPSRFDKEREARDEIRANTSGSSSMPTRIDTSAQPAPIAQSPPRSNTLISSSSTGVTESTPLISSAPPAYSPPEPGSPYHQRTRSSTSAAGIYETMGRPTTFFPNSAADLGGDTESFLPNGSGEKRWSSRVVDWWEENSYKVFKYIMLVLALLVAVGFLAELITQLSDDSGEWRHGHEGVHLPGIPSSCRIRDSGHIKFSWEKPSDFSLIHLPKPVGNGPRESHVRNLGQIHVRSLPKDIKDAFQVEMSYHFSSLAVSEEFEFSKEDEMLRIYTASTVQDYGTRGYQPCLYLNITIWLNADLQPDDFYIHTTTLDVIFDKDHTAQAQNVTVQTYTGSVTSNADAGGLVSWGGRDITIITDSSSIQGSYPLYDKLHLETRSGSITTQLTLHPGLHDRESEALLILKTTSGSIQAKTPMLRSAEEGWGNYTIDDIPKRDYQTEVELRSGSAQLQLIHGSRTSIFGNTGSIQAELTPWLEPRKDSNIIVDSKTGGIDVTVRDAIAYKGEPLRHLYSQYKFPTGHLTLRYPDEWEGEIVGQLMTGSLNIDWPGLEVRRYERLNLYNQVEARKGKGDGWIHFTGGSGSADLLGRGGKRYPKTFDQPLRLDEGGEDQLRWRTAQTHD